MAGDVEQGCAAVSVNIYYTMARLGRDLKRVEPRTNAVALDLVLVHVDLFIPTRKHPHARAPRMRVQMDARIRRDDLVQEDQ